MTAPYGTTPGGAGDLGGDTGDLSVTSGEFRRRQYSTAPEWTGPGYQGGPPVGVGTRTGRRWRRKHTLGCFGSLVAIVVLGVGIQLAFTPWAVHIGGSFTPMMRWTGVAEAHTASGASYAVQLTINANNLSQHACSQYGCDDFHGTLTVCTAAGMYTFTNVSGTVGGWLSTDGQDMNVSFSHGSTTADRGLLGYLRGTWHGKVYQATDAGYLDRDFQPDGTPRTSVGSAVAADAATLAFQPGDFTSACKQVARGG